MSIDRALSTPGATDVERRAMALALTLASRAEAAARPNPGVGCVILADGVEVGRGSTGRVGGPHAEIEALAAAGDRARGATAVVTLEPCDHQGRTGPCSLALMGAGIARVVLATADPSPGASGGAQRLRAAGVEVVSGVFADAAREVHRAFLLRARFGRPAVTLKVAMTQNGRLAVLNRPWVTGPEARRQVHALRALCDGVLVGVGTVLVDDPRLDVRDHELLAAQPRPIVLDSDLRTPVDSAVVGRGALIVAADRVGRGVDESRRLALQAAGAEVLAVPEATSGRLDLHKALQAIGELGLTSILAEPGPTLGQAMLVAELVDDVVLHVSADVAHGPDLPTVAAALAHPLSPDLPHDLRRVRLLGDDLEIWLRLTLEGSTRAEQGSKTSMSS